MVFAVGGGRSDPKKHQRFPARKHYPMFPDNVSGPEIGLPGQTSAGFYTGKPQNRPSGRPSAGRRAEAFPTRIRPTSGSEARFPARSRYSVTYGIK